MRQTSLHTPVGEVTIFAEDDALVALDWGRGGLPGGSEGETPLLVEARRQLHAFFDGELLAFDLPLRPSGSAFQLRVWAALCAIPCGETRSYGQLAQELTSAARAIGQANARNPLPILIPCHRVIGASGALGGFSGGEGPETKRWLLLHEMRTRRGLDPRPGQELIP
ncbi:methylated-DNA-[protein]-cysteine S-methyltransferase [Humitalea rosea]|uniref:Methylated-DNA--protein-cysteine methyltransferase n=1 Tax=Humitalea rosea TaxID=990373 RepID=A0A2W7II70_9PROT|nr:methylated-DNA--[protein]-cysteine S-methyltransferase [Humitalea rosea]PZW46585.1 methylated-DNA-[protein]-cysteine S-methyltransferase [Humitalea rosea]